MENTKTIEWETLFKYFLFLDKKYKFNKFTSDKTNLVSRFDFNIDEKNKYKLRFNKYLYYVEFINLLSSNGEYKPSVIPLNNFVAFENGFEYYPSQKRLNENLFFQFSEEIENMNDDEFLINEELKRIIFNVSKFFNDFTDEELVEEINDDPIWRKKWAYKINNSLVNNTFKKSNVLQNQPIDKINSNKDLNIEFLDAIRSVYKNFYKHVME